VRASVSECDQLRTMVQANWRTSECEQVLASASEFEIKRASKRASARECEPVLASAIYCEPTGGKRVRASANKCERVPASARKS